jgi:hypothetical protein
MGFLIHGLYFDLVFYFLSSCSTWPWSLFQTFFTSLDLNFLESCPWGYLTILGETPKVNLTNPTNTMFDNIGFTWLWNLGDAVSMRHINVSLIHFYMATLYEARNGPLACLSHALTELAHDYKMPAFCTKILWLAYTDKPVRFIPLTI